MRKHAETRRPRMVVTSQTSSMEIALNVDERGTEFQNATRTKLQISGASIARTILTTSKIAAKGNLTQRSLQQDLKMTLVVSFVFTMKDQESRGELISNLLVDTYLVPRVFRNMSAGRENGTLIMVHTDLRPFFSRTFQGLFKDKSFSFKDLIFYSIRHTCNKPININDFLYGMLCKETCNINRKLP